MRHIRIHTTLLGPARTTFLTYTILLTATVILLTSTAVLFTSTVLLACFSFHFCTLWLWTMCRNVGFRALSIHETPKLFASAGFLTPTGRVLFTTTGTS